MADRTDYPARIADLLEDLATRVRALSIDRIAGVVTWVTFGLVLLVLVTLAGFWLAVGAFRALGRLIGVEAAYAVAGGIFLLAGALVWRKRVLREDVQE